MLGLHLGRKYAKYLRRARGRGGRVRENTFHGRPHRSRPPTLGDISSFNDGARQERKPVKQKQGSVCGCETRGSEVPGRILYVV